ncbi:hypothetical protein N9E50_00505 [Alphaproteobacteria bacterium]|nr:hypothetical protein [Alphaproteobacteria bacterium]
MNNTFTYSANYKIRINDYNYDKFLKNYEVMNSNLFGLSFDNFERDHSNKVLYNRDFMLDEFNRIFSTKTSMENSLNKKFLILTSVEKNHSTPILNFNINHKFNKTYSENLGLSNIKLETSQKANSIFNHSFEKFASTINDYQNDLFKIYKNKTIQELKSLKKNATGESILTNDSKNQFMLNLIMELIVSEQSDQSMENTWKKSDIFMSILNQLEDLSISDLNKLDSKVEALYNSQIQEIKNLEYESNKVKIDFFEFTFVNETNPDINFFNNKIIFLLFIFLFVSNVVFAFFSK